MTIAISERTKHRLMGLVVIISIAVIFLPAMMKQSNKHLQESTQVALKFPAKPVAPNIIIPKQQAMFKTTNIASMAATPKINKAELQSIQITAVEPIQPIPPKEAKIAATYVSVLEKINIPIAVVKKLKSTTKLAVNTKALPLPLKLKKDFFSIQLASFLQEVNAQKLVSTLKHQGYVAFYNKFASKQGAYYKVMVGQMNKRNEAIYLQQKLAANLQLNGLIVQAVS